MMLRGSCSRILVRHICIIPCKHYLLICHAPIDATRDLVIKARTGDHGPFLIENAKKDLPDMKIELENLGVFDANVY